MTMNANRVVALCEQAAYFLQEDVSLIESGSLKLQLFGTDVTQEQAERMKAPVGFKKLSKVAGVIAYAGECLLSICGH